MAKNTQQLFEEFSFEATVKDVTNLANFAEKVAIQTVITIPYLPTDTNEARVVATLSLRSSGFQPMPHFAARRIASETEFLALLNGVVQAGAARCLVIAGDLAQPQGPYTDSLKLIKTGAFERVGIKTIGIAGHPEGHSFMTSNETFEAIERKVSAIEMRGMKSEILTQFAFDADAVLQWLKELRKRGLVTPVRLGVAGPASLKTLLRFAALCGVASSAAIVAKYGLSLTNLLGSSGPEKFVARLLTELTSEHGEVHLHFYPFGGVQKTLNWIAAHT